MTFPCCRGSDKSLKYQRKTMLSLNAPQSAMPPSIAASPLRIRGLKQIQHSFLMSRTFSPDCPGRKVELYLRIDHYVCPLLLGQRSSTLKHQVSRPCSTPRSGFLRICRFLEAFLGSNLV